MILATALTFIAMTWMSFWYIDGAVKAVLWKPGTER